MTRATGLVAFTLACSPPVADTKPVEPPDPTMHATVLTASAPRQELVLPAFSTAPTTLALTITAIENPAGLAFSVSASATWRGGDGAIAEADLGNITPFPADRPGMFLVSLPEPGRAILGHTEGRLTVILSLQAIAERPLVEPLKVTLAAPRWR